jgi:DUF2075 family protein
MISFKIEKLDFNKDAVAAWMEFDEKHANWPVVYVLDDGRDISKSKNKLRNVYVGESLNAVKRLRQHLESPAKQSKNLKYARVIICEQFNKSVCLDLESYLIRRLAGDGGNQVLNQNNGITETMYYQREAYRDSFRRIFDRLRTDGVFTRGIDEIENSELYKLSPFKALTDDQASSVEEIVRRFLVDIERGAESTIVIQGDPGTGKSVVAIYIIKLLVDIRDLDESLGDPNPDATFSHFFTDTNKRLLEGLKMGLVVPQTSLRETIKSVFKNTEGLDPKMVLNPYEVAESEGMFDLVLVDEAHRLNQRASQASGKLNAKVKSITLDLFGWDDTSKTQLDWIQAKSRHHIFLLDTMQGVRPADLPPEVMSELVRQARATNRHFQLQTQMRVRAGSDYVGYIRWMLDPRPRSVPRQRLHFGEYDFYLFDTVEELRERVRERENEVGLSRLVAGYAWNWKTKKDKEAIDIEIGGTRLRWNSATKGDWVSSDNAVEEVGSVHVVQGYDLNYVGVIIGLDLRFRPDQSRLCVDRKSYFDTRGKANNKILGTTCSDDDLLRFITQIYAVLMTRGIRGTYVYACDPGLREYLRHFIPSSKGDPVNSAVNPASFDPLLLD